MDNVYHIAIKDQNMKHATFVQSCDSVALFEPLTGAPQGGPKATDIYNRGLQVALNQIWSKTIELTNTLRVSTEPNEELSNLAVGMVTGTNKTLLTIHSEILNRILQLKDDLNYTIHPKRFVELTLRHLVRREKNAEIKSNLEDLLQTF